MALRSHCTDFLNNLVRKKNITEDIVRKDLKKVLKLSDLTFLAVGSMIGSGLYVLTGAVARIAGPSIVISYFLAAVASILSAVCYAEFAARVPVTGSAYQYTYLSIGEIWAFVVGWNVFLEHTVLAASIAKGWSGYVDGLCGFAISTFLKKHLPMPGGLVAEYPDFLAGMLVILLTLIVARGVKISSTVNIFFAAVNLTVIVFIFCTGMYLAKGEYWQGEKTFFPHGWSGTISGAATLIFSYVGYEVVATATEESVNPKRDVPLSLLISLSVVVVAYVGVSTVLTLMVPWNLISVSSPFPNAYHFRGWDWAGYVVSIGALAAMTAAMLSTLLVIPRYLYAMARDGLLWRFLDVVNDDTGVPITATAISGGFCLLLTLMFGLVALVEFISVGQLLACTFVSICVVKLRYGPSDVSSYETLADDGEPTPQDAGQSTNFSTSLPECQTSSKASSNTEETPLTRLNSEAAVGATQYQTTAVAEVKCPGTIKESVLEAKYGYLLRRLDSLTPGNAPFYLLLVAILFATVAIAMLLFGHQHLHQAWFILLFIVFLAIAVLSLLSMLAFHQRDTIQTFAVPLVPLVPFSSIMVNITLLLKLQPLTWLRFAVWMSIGLLIYFLYGYRHSNSRKQDE